MFVYQIFNRVNGKKYVGQHAGQDLLKYWRRTVYFARKMTEDNFRKLMSIHVGAKRTEEARRKMSESHKGKPWSDKRLLSHHKTKHINTVNSNCKFCKHQS